ncbi:MAG: phosphotransferase [Gaiellaceae bacterium]
MSAVDAAVAVAEAHGIGCDDPVVLRRAWHVLVHLRPAPVVARVTSGAPGVDPDGVVRELIVARHAARAGAPVVEPSDLLDPGPHEYDGRIVVFWRFVETRGELDAAAAGRGLHTLHEALEDFDGELPRCERRHDVEAMLATAEPAADIDVLRELASRELPAGQALHGDAHLYNCMQTERGPIWHDLETACRGPRELDLAALLLRSRSEEDEPAARAALAAYGAFDADLLEAALPVYGAWIAASWLTAAARRPELGARVERLLVFLRRYAG